MTAFMDRSIDLMEEIARETGNRINLNRRGYLFATADASKIPFLETMAKKAQERGAGTARVHTASASAYEPAQQRGFDSPITGADIITNTSLIRQHFPYLSPDTIAVAHVRRAGWLSAQQLGAVMLEAVRTRGIKVVRGEVIGIGIIMAAQVRWMSRPEMEISRSTQPTSFSQAGLIRKNSPRWPASTSPSLRNGIARSASRTRAMRCRAKHR
jgi:glycine/D-amino acid oxidase-like deaminating enzyme